MPRRTTMILDESTEAKLAELATSAGSKTEAVRLAIEASHRSLARQQARADLVDWLISEYGEPSAEDDQWAAEIAAQTAAARERLR